MQDLLIAVSLWMRDFRVWLLMEMWALYVVLVLVLVGVGAIAGAGAGAAPVEHQVERTEALVVAVEEAVEEEDVVEAVVDVEVEVDEEGIYVFRNILLLYKVRFLS